MSPKIRHGLKILRRHWLATTILFCSLGVITWYGYGGYASQNTALKENKSTIANTVTEIKNQETVRKSPEPNQIQKTKNNSTVATTSSESLDTTKEKGIDLGVETTFFINNQSYTVNVIPGTSVYDAMRILDGNKISVKFKSYSGLGYFVDGINGQNSDTLGGHYWIYYINGAKAQIGISSYILKPHDIITWKYEAQE